MFQHIYIRGQSFILCPLHRSAEFCTHRKGLEELAISGEWAIRGNLMPKHKEYYMRLMSLRQNVTCRIGIVTSFLSLYSGRLERTFSQILSIRYFNR